MDLIACGFKSQLTDIRDAIRNIDILLTKSKFESKKATLEQYKNGIKADLVAKGKRQIKIIDDHCIGVTGSPIPLIYFRKLQADIYRYMAESTGIADGRVEFKEAALKTYKESVYTLKCLRELRVQQNKPDPIDSLRLGLNLNYAIFLWEIMEQKKKAIRILKREIQEALDDFDKWDQSQIE
mmetsp:Transcript_10366/g.15956  ORF Transcript_10366/g.15956 Transcript_10366/m.15956 type:complete len:182 (+) Transcript_10366:463-1008(+)